jgi:hypothetical protein
VLYFTNTRAPSTDIQDSRQRIQTNRDLIPFSVSDDVYRCTLLWSHVSYLPSCFHQIKFQNFPPSVVDDGRYLDIIQQHSMDRLCLHVVCLSVYRDEGDSEIAIEFFISSLGSVHKSHPERPELKKLLFAIFTVQDGFPESIDLCFATKHVVEGFSTQAQCLRTDSVDGNTWDEADWCIVFLKLDSLSVLERGYSALKVVYSPLATHSSHEPHLSPSLRYIRLQWIILPRTDGSVIYSKLIKLLSSLKGTN